MRWPFRRSAPARDEPETTVDAAPVPAPAAPQAWRELEPLRTIRPLELTADGRRFSQGLGVRQPADLALAPLGHDLSLGAPQGLVTNLARAVVASPNEPDMPTVPRRRAAPEPIAERRPMAVAPPPARESEPSAPPAQASEPSASPAEAPAAPAAPALRATAAEPAPSVAPGAPPRAETQDRPAGGPLADAPPEPEIAATAEPDARSVLEPAPLPVRQLEAVARPTASIASARSELPLVPRPMPAVQAVRSSAAEAPEPVAPASVDQAASSPSPQIAPESPADPARASQLPTVGSRLEPTIETSTPTVPVGDAPQVPDRSQTPDPRPVRRSGLGAPLTEPLPERASTPTPVRPLVVAAPPVSADPALAPASAASPIAPPSATPPVGPVVRPAPVGHQRSADPAPTLPDAPAAVESPSPDQARPQRPAAETVPLVGAEEIRRSDPAPIAESPIRSEPGHGERSELPVSPGLRPHRGPERAPSSPMRPLAGATPIGTAPAPAARAVQRELGSLAAPRPTQAPARVPAAAAATAARPLTATSGPEQRAPSPRTEAPAGGGMQSNATAVVAEPATATTPSLHPQPLEAPAVRRLTVVPDLPATREVEPALRPVPLPASAPSFPSPSPPVPPVRGSRAPAAVAMPVASTAPARRPVQRAVEINELEIKPTPADPAPPAGPGPAAPPAPGAGASAAPAGTPAAAAQDPEHLREQVLRWVRAELLVNRERAGRLTDLR